METVVLLLGSDTVPADLLALREELGPVPIFLDCYENGFFALQNRA